MFGQIEKDGDGSDPFNSFAVVEEKDPEDNGDEEGTRVGSCGQKPSNFESWSGRTCFLTNLKKFKAILKYKQKQTNTNTNLKKVYGYS